MNRKRPRRARPARGWGGTDRSASRSILALVLTALAAFTAVSTGAVVVAGRIARKQALDEALRSAHVVGNTVFVPFLPGVIRGDPAAIVALDNAVRLRSRDGSLLRVKVWKRDGTVIYSDDHAAIGGRFPLHSDVAETIDAQRDQASVSHLTDPENATEAMLGRKLVEVYIPLNLDDGTRLAFESYSTDQRVVQVERSLRDQLVPFGLLALTLLVVLQLPVSAYLVRRVSRAQEERSRLLSSALDASGRERRSIVRDLHDGVVQELAAAGYAVDALEGSLPENASERSRYLVDAVRGVLRTSVASLRTMMIDIYPRDLSAGGLPEALDDLAGGLRDKTGASVDVVVDLAAEPSSEVVAMVYRTAREAFNNVAAHAIARRVVLHLHGDERTVRLQVDDDGVGIDTDRLEGGVEGHFGLRMLVDGAGDLGGSLQVWSAATGGTTLLLELPTEGVGQMGRGG